MLPAPMSFCPWHIALYVHTCKPCLTALGHLLALLLTRYLRGGFRGAYKVPTMLTRWLSTMQNSMRMLGTPCAQKQGVAAAAGARQQQCKGVAGGSTERTGGVCGLGSHRPAPALRHAHHGVCARAPAGAVCKVVMDLHPTRCRLVEL